MPRDKCAEQLNDFKKQQTVRRNRFYCNYRSVFEVILRRFSVKLSVVGGGGRSWSDFHIIYGEDVG